MKDSRTYDFTIEFNGKTYNCQREVSGKRDLYQMIYVHKFGYKQDPALYGVKGHPVETMATTARLIAFEIIQGL